MTDTLAAPPTPPPPAPAAQTPRPRIGTPGRIVGAILQLAAMGAIGSAVFTILCIFLPLGIGLLPILGIGVLFLIAFEYILFALGWFEVARIDGLYRFGLTPRRPRTSGRPGFTGFLRTLWLQFIDLSMWRAVASAAVSTILGLILLAQVRNIASGVALLFLPLVSSTDEIHMFDTGLTVPTAWAVPVGVGQIVLGFAIMIGMALLQGLLARVILVPSREAVLAEQARTSQVQRAGAVRAADVERTRIERDLHDGVQPRLVSVGMTLGLAQQKIDSDPEAAKALIAEAHTSTKAAITELRQLARGIHTSVLTDRGLDAALSALAARSPIPVSLDVRLEHRCSPDAEAAVYFVIAEALTNAAKHSRGKECRVLVRQRVPTPTPSPAGAVLGASGGVAPGNTVWARIEDDGIGGAVVVPGGGLDGLGNRVLGVGGTLRLESPAGGPTSVEVSVPCAF
ncbi:sensor histidine kinase [Microbacterium sp. ASV49]|uniref:histidine kinase n=1 Tax=Microbacterium candidum TaxID=3041922 RepID=A0ABT7MXW3_9MICO|nr:histidine kinase [Microbacterium sp. ASV49]MDL9979297.1 histidine kinase [Microbacterium sp. ASV49]